MCDYHMQVVKLLCEFKHPAKLNDITKSTVCAALCLSKQTADFKWYLKGYAKLS